jgi:hypothetical protein
VQLDGLFDPMKTACIVFDDVMQNVATPLGEKAEFDHDKTPSVTLNVPVIFPDVGSNTPLAMPFVVETGFPFNKSCPLAKVYTVALWQTPVAPRLDRKLPRSRR